jgi:3-dehydroquinate dehydratase-2
MSILIINGPNLNLLGTREPAFYGTETLADVEATAKSLASTHGLSLETFQSNHEGAIIDRIHAAAGFGPHGDNQRHVDWIIINPGAFTHTSVGIRDALTGVNIPFVECHISNVHAREAFRHKSFLSDEAFAVIAALGTFGYEASVNFVARKIKTRK